MSAVVINTITDGDYTPIFEPKRNLRGIAYNYLLETQNNGVVAEYDSGEIDACILPTKNSLDSMYSMNMPNLDQLSGCREYVQVNQCANMIYLKFYDNVSYSKQSSVSNNGVEDIDVARSGTVKYPYQKIEILEKNMFTSKRKHKSNLFSIRISDIPEFDDRSMSESEDGMEKDIKTRIKKDIQTAVYEITKNVCPTNTQFFKLYFR